MTTRLTKEHFDSIVTEGETGYTAEASMLEHEFCGQLPAEIEVVTPQGERLAVFQLDNQITDEDGNVLYFGFSNVFGKPLIVFND